MTRRAPGRVRPLPDVERLLAALSARDWAIVDAVTRLRLVSGPQLERLCFASLSPRSRASMRGRVLARLVRDHVLVPLERPVGGARRGSTQACYALDPLGQRLAAVHAAEQSGDVRPRRVGRPGERFIAHTLAVSELYVSLVELARTGTFRLDDFRAEPFAWWPNGTGGWLKPDGFVKLSTPAVTEYWWLEVDLHTESLPTLRNKLLVYLDFLAMGQRGPDGIMPWVLIGVTSAARQTAVRSLLTSLPPPAEQLFRVELLADSPRYMVQELVQWSSG